MIDLIDYEIYPYNIRRSEIFENWLISFNKVDNTRMSANIMPDPFSLILFLYNNNLLSDKIKRYMPHTVKGMNMDDFKNLLLNSLIIDIVIKNRSHTAKGMNMDEIKKSVYESLLMDIDTRKDIDIISATFDFCANLLHYNITKNGQSLAVLFTGESVIDRAKNKIKEELIVNYPNPARELIKYLKEKKLIALNVNPVCDTLSKDL